MDEVRRGPPKGRPLSRRDPRRLAGGGALLAAAFAVLAFFDRAVAGILFLAGMSLLLDGMGQFHPLFALLFPVLALMGAIMDASRGLWGAALRWSVGVGVILALGRVLRRRLVSPVRPNPPLEALTTELAALKAKRERGAITEDEFRARRDAAVAAFRGASPESPAPEPPLQRP
jgi:hypothetical protein